MEPTSPNSNTHLSIPQEPYPNKEPPVAPVTTSLYAPRKKIPKAEAKRRALNSYAKMMRVPPHMRAGTRFVLSPERAVYVQTHQTHETGALAVGGYYFETGRVFQGGGSLGQIAHLAHKPPLLSLHAATFNDLIRKRCEVWEMIDIVRNEVWRISMAQAVKYGFGYSAKLGSKSIKRWGVPLNRCTRSDANWRILNEREFDPVDVPLTTKQARALGELDAGQSQMLFDL